MPRRLQRKLQSPGRRVAGSAKRRPRQQQQQLQHSRAPPVCNALLVVQALIAALPLQSDQGVVQGARRSAELFFGERGAEEQVVKRRVGSVTQCVVACMRNA